MLQGATWSPHAHAQGNPETLLTTAPHELADSLHIGGQEQFYLEGQISTPFPKENDSLFVHCSTQHPSEMQHAIAKALNWHAHQVQVECRRMGRLWGKNRNRRCLPAWRRWRPGGSSAQSSCAWTVMTTS